MGDKDYQYRAENREPEADMLRDVMAQRTAQEWEDFLQGSHVPAGRIRTMGEALEDPQLETRNILHQHATVPGVGDNVTVPMCAFKLAHGGPSIETPPPQLGEHNDDILGELGYAAKDIAALRDEGVI